jgi:hypothetical protein
MKLESEFCESYKFKERKNNVRTKQKKMFKNFDFWGENIAKYLFSHASLNYCRRAMRK